MKHCLLFWETLNLVISPCVSDSNNFTISHVILFIAERAENITYNALPATITPDMWAHQYIQQSNEMNAVVSEDHIWNSDGPFATLYVLITPCTLIP